MAVQAERAQFAAQYQALNQAVTRWDRRERFALTVKWIPRGFIVALSVAIGLALISRVRPFLLPNQLMTICSLLLILAAGLCVGVIWLRRRTPLESARHFDVIFNLGERVSTALELIEGRITTNEEFITRQISSAHHAAQSVKAAPFLGEKLPPRELFMLSILALIFAALLWLPNPQADAINANVAQEIAIETAEEALREIIQIVAADPNLPTPERENLLQALEQSRRALERSNITPEEAFAALSSASSTLQQGAQTLNENTAAAQDALAQAAQRLAQVSPSTADQSASSSADLAETLAQLAQQLESFEEQQRQEAAQALQEAAQNLRQQQQSQMAQQLAQQMEQAAEQMQNGATNQAQQSLNQAQQSADQMQQQAQNQQSAAEQLEQSAQDANAAAQELAQQTGDAQGEGQPENPQGDGQSQEGDQSGQGNNPSQTGDNAAQSEGGGEGESAQGEGNTPTEGEGDGQGSGEGTDDTQGEGASTGENGASGSGAGAGDESGGQNSTTGTQQTNIDRNNNPDGEGLREYAPIYRPPLNLNAGDNPLFLDPNADEAPVIEGNFSENPSGEASVPYNQVFSDYRNAANRAINSGAVPLSMQDIVREYFSSLEP